MPENRDDRYKPGTCAALRASLSSDRFQRYLDQKGGDEVAALQLYTWNSALAGAFYAPLQACEVALRNATDDAIGFRYGDRWFLNESLLYPFEIDMAKDAIAKIERRGKEATPGRVIVELGFAYWVSLYATTYDSRLWRTMLCYKFTPRPYRHDLFTDLDKLRTLRNRIAHHEPIYHRNLIADMERITEVLKRLSPPVADWVEQHTRVYETIALAPAQVLRF